MPARGCAGRSYLRQQLNSLLSLPLRQRLNPFLPPRARLWSGCDPPAAPALSPHTCGRGHGIPRLCPGSPAAFPRLPLASAPGHAASRPGGAALAAPEPGACCPCCPRSLRAFPGAAAGIGTGQFDPLAEGLKASWCSGSLQGFQSLLEVFHYPPSPAIGGNWAPEIRTRLLERIWARQLWWQVPPRGSLSPCPAQAVPRALPQLGLGVSVPVFAVSPGSVTAPGPPCRNLWRAERALAHPHRSAPPRPPLPPPRLAKPRLQTEEAELVCGF